MHKVRLVERRSARSSASGSKKIRALVLTGTRPDIIKMAPVYRALQSLDADVALVHSGQHQDEVERLYEFFGMVPLVSLNLGRRGPSLAHLSGRLLERLDPVCESLRPDVIFVQGDTSTALMGALLGFYQKVPVAHVEAGLRSGRLDEPFPEEMNRRLITSIARWHFAPTPLAVAQLRKEGVALKDIVMTGNTVVDAALWGYEKLAVCARGLSWSAGRKLILVTAHRRENWGAGVALIAAAMGVVLERFPDIEVMWALHPNPEVAGCVRSAISGWPAPVLARLHLVAPLSYPDMLTTLARTWVLVTDSGGLQEEATTARVPVLITRRQTERPEVIECGAGLLVGADTARIVQEVTRLYRDRGLWEGMRPSCSPFGDGQTGIRIARHVLRAWTRASVAAAVGQ